MGKRRVGAQAAPSLPGLRAGREAESRGPLGPRPGPSPRHSSSVLPQEGLCTDPKALTYLGISRGSSPASIPEPEKTVPSAKTQGPRL